jgi:LmbE family N-acetylglucosaminyl deacetylase
VSARGGRERPLPLTFPRRGGALKVLCLGAHPDDIEIGCGATILGLVGQAADVRWAVFSGNERRAEEAARSARLFLGADAGRRLTLHTFRDGYFPAEFAAVKEACEDVAARFRPDLVFTHFRDDRHQDHRVLSDLAWNTFRKHVVLEYEIPKWDGDLSTPNLYAAVTPRTARRKVTLLSRAFASQRSKDWFGDEVFFGLMRLRGMECRSPSGFAEAFYGRKLTFQP